jgi:hypothetical protein
MRSQAVCLLFGFDILSFLRSRKQRLTAVGIRCADHVTPSIRKKLALTSPSSGGRSVGIVRSRTKTTESSGFYCSVAHKRIP